MKKDIELFIHKFKKNNMNIYENNPKNNFKQYYIDCLDIINKISKIEDKINLIEFKENYILCKYNISDENINKPIQLLNCFDEKFMKEYEEECKKKGLEVLAIEINEKEIKECCELYLNDKKIDFNFKYIFNKSGEYNLKFNFNKLLTNISYLFYDITQLTSLDLSNFNTNKITSMRSMFSECSSLII